MSPPLIRSVKDAVALSSSKPVVDAGAGLGVSDTNWPFLPVTSSVVAGKALHFVGTLLNRKPYAPPSAAEARELSEYLALSTCCHVLDGWRYLSQSSLALLSGAPNEALHMAYYAELRAALSILANSGVGVLKEDHFALTAGGGVEWFKGSTHSKTWEALQHWAEKPIHARAVVAGLAALGVQASVWASATGAVPQQLAEHWVRNWSIDLKSLNHDSYRRNEASYRPNLRADAFDPISATELDFVRDVNSACDPIDPGTLGFVDTAIIYDLCSKAYRLQYQPSTLPLKRFWEGVRHRLQVVGGLSEADAAEKVSAVRVSMRTVGGKLLKTSRQQGTSVFGVFSRALLLLRLASALHRLQWEEIRLRTGKSDWQTALLKAYAVQSQLCESVSATTDYQVLTADQADAQGDLNDFLTRNPDLDARRMWKEIPHVLVALCRLQRVAVIAAAP